MLESSSKLCVMYIYADVVLARKRGNSLRRLHGDEQVLFSPSFDLIDPNRWVETYGAINKSRFVEVLSCFYLYIYSSMSKKTHSDSFGYGIENLSL